MTVAEYRIVRTGRPDVCAVEHKNPRRRNWRHVGYVSEREADSLIDRHGAVMSWLQSGFVIGVIVDSRTEEVLNA